jgi:hypothetical protein
VAGLWVAAWVCRYRQSTLLKAVHDLFPDEVTLTFGSGGELTFGLENLEHAHQITIPELRPTEFFKTFPLAVC